MSLQELSTEDLVKEIQRRKSVEVVELRRQIDEHRKAIRELEDRIRARGESEAAPRRGRSSSSSIPAGERSERVLTALEGSAGLNVAEIAAKVGFDGASLKKTIEELISERKLSRSGKARGTKYALA
jgi:hypothetical protein